MKNQIIVSAGDAITAKLVQEAGFDGIWISGFESCARLGLPDNGSITLKQMINIAKPIVRAVDIPVWVDVDTGYQDFQETVLALEDIGVHGVSIEDNIPELKQNSLWGKDIPIMNADKFCDKLLVRRNCIKTIARTEAIIRGYGAKEAMLRCRKYIDCADMVLPHTRNASQLIAWKDTDVGNIPAAIVPTKFPQFPNKELFNLGYKMVIWANQTERVKIKAIREALADLKLKDSALDIENELSATLEDMKGLMPNA